MESEQEDLRGLTEESPLETSSLADLAFKFEGLRSTVELAYINFDKEVWEEVSEFLLGEIKALKALHEGLCENISDEHRERLGEAGRLLHDCGNAVGYVAGNLVTHDMHIEIGSKQESKKARDVAIGNLKKIKYLIDGYFDIDDEDSHTEQDLNEIFKLAKESVNIDCTLTMANEIGLISGLAARRIFFILSNLMVNAENADANKVEVRVVARGEKQVTFKVTDDGKGLDTNGSTLEAYSIERKSRDDGHGEGLRIVCSNVSIFKGKLRHLLLNDGIITGTSFEFTLERSRLQVQRRSEATEAA